MASRQLTDLTDKCVELFYSFRAEMQYEGLLFQVTCTLRTKEEQAELYAQGRTKPGKIVTWTLTSKHLPGPDGKARAFDIVILKDGKAVWDEAWYKKAAELARKVGLKPGADFGDYCHFELKEG